MEVQLFKQRLVDKSCFQQHLTLIRSGSCNILNAELWKDQQPVNLYVNIQVQSAIRFNPKLEVSE